uniref:Extracellular leucine rich repeat and fibronectin type III domain containing 1 n=1 Tax=Callorhinchus milii TaxID=7868 RepID=A0A4W3IHA9_CALMI|eukprot:gi/632974919/ref/XP_007903941.1/ PREDICTED: protein ELFN1-like [Callorhinchus milii]
MALFSLCLWVSLVVLMNAVLVRADCWLIEGEKGFVWLAICSQNQPPYEAIPQHINSTIVDLRLNENKIKSIQFSSLNRFGNLTDLNLTKNDISYIEDGAFSAQFNLRILQLGFNRLQNLTEGILRGLGRLEYLYLQANLIEIVSPNTFWECLSIINIDLSMNRLQRLESSTFTGLSKLYVCELYSNPFYCSCDLLGFLKWLAMFTNTTRNYDRMQCESPPEFAGYALLSQSRTSRRNAYSILSSKCEENYRVDSKVALNVSTPIPTTTTTTTESPCGSEDCASGDGSSSILSSPTPFFNGKPMINVQDVTDNTASLLVHIPHRFRKMYVLLQYNNNLYTHVQILNKEEEIIKFDTLKALTEYTFCVASIRNAFRYNHTCVTFSTLRQTKVVVTTPSTATHYIMTILGCLFGMVIVLGVVYYCLRKKRQQMEKQKKSGNIKKTLIELKYGGELETSTISQLSQKPIPPCDNMPRMPFLPSSGDMEQYKSKDLSETPKTAKGNYIEVRTGDAPDRRDVEGSQIGESQSSTAEISTIAKEVDKVNQIINNCIDALKSEPGSFQGGKSGAMASIDPQLLMITEQTQGRSGFLSPIYKESYHPLQRHSSMDTAPKRSSTSSSGSIRSPRSFRSEASAGPTYKSEAKYIEKTSPTTETIMTVSPGVILRSEADKIRQYSEHRHSYPGSHQGEQQQEAPSRKPSILEPLTRPRRDLMYSQLSPQYHNLSYSSSPEYSSKPSQGIWERFKLHKKRHKEDDEYMAAGHALRRKVQFAKDEDLHDILDYWKGVSAQHKS